MFSDCVLRQSGRCCLQDGRPQRTDAAAELEAAPTPPPSFTLVGGRGYWQGGGARGVHLTALQVRQSRCSFAEQDMKFGIETHFLFFLQDSCSSRTEETGVAEAGLEWKELKVWVKGWKDFLQTTKGHCKALSFSRRTSRALLTSKQDGQVRASLLFYHFFTQTRASPRIWCCSWSECPLQHRRRPLTNTNLWSSILTQPQYTSLQLSDLQDLHQSIPGFHPQMWNSTNWLEHHDLPIRILLIVKKWSHTFV